MTDLLVVVVVYLSDDTLDTFLRSLSSATRRSVRVIVVDNGPTPTGRVDSPDPSMEIEYVDSSDNPGYGTAVNRGFASARGEAWLLVSNPDLVFDPGALDTLIGEAQEVTGLGLIGPLIRTPAGEIYPSARRLPSLRIGIGHAILSRTWPANPWTRKYTADRESPPRRREAGWLSGACFLVPAEVFRKIGGFDESYFMYFEDVDLGARIGSDGYKIVYLPTAGVTHIGGSSTSGASRRMILAHHRSAYLYLSRRYNAWYLAPVRCALRAGLAIRARVVHG